MADLLNSNEMFYTSAEMKVQNRFIMTIDGIPAFTIKKVDRPKVTSAKQTIDYINLQRYYKGKTTWGDITAELYDPIVPSAAQAVMEWIRLSHESITGRDGYMDFYKKDIIINVIGPVGDKVEEWKGIGAWVQNADFGNLDWGNDGTPCAVTIVIVADYWILNY